MPGEHRHDHLARRGKTEITGAILEIDGFTGFCDEFVHGLNLAKAEISAKPHRDRPLIGRAAAVLPCSG